MTKVNLNPIIYDLRRVGDLTKVYSDTINRPNTKRFLELTEYAKKGYGITREESEFLLDFYLAASNYLKELTLLAKDILGCLEMESRRYFEISKTKVKQVIAKLPANLLKLFKKIFILEVELQHIGNEKRGRRNPTTLEHIAPTLENFINSTVALV